MAAIIIILLIIIIINISWGFEDRVLRRIFQSKKEQEDGTKCIMGT
jgi:hypothetical protein